MKDTASVVLKYCGVDVAKSSLVCAAIADLSEHRRHYLPGQARDLGLVDDEPVQSRTFSNSWEGLIDMTDWMRSVGVSAAVMESTGIYWCAAYTAIERAGIQPVLVNAYQVKSVPGRKTDLRDSVWLAVLLRGGFVRPSYVPTGHIRELRDLTRERARVQRDITRLKNRCHRVLDTVVVQLAMGDVFGTRSRRRLMQALQGDHSGLSEGQRMMVTELMMNIEELEGRRKRYDAALVRVVEELERDGDRDIALLMTIPGVGLPSAEVLKAEIGEVGRFESAERLASYSGLVPRVYQSREVMRTGSTGGQCNRHIRTAMYMVAQVCARVGPRELREFHERVRRRKGMTWRR